MKAKVIIEHGHTQIVLTPETDFERDIIEKVESKNDRFDLETKFRSEYNYGVQKNHKIQIDIIEKQSV